MHGVAFLQDMAIVMIVAGLVTVIFHRLKQPVVLGYILAGLIIGPHTFGGNLIQENHTIQVLADLGVIMLMFGLGLHFSLKDLARVGPPAFVAAILEILFMISIGYLVGRVFGWSKQNSLFLGAIMSISSTTIIIKALQELGLTKEPFSRQVFGILIGEDILAIAMLALLPGIAISGQLGAGDLLGTFGRLAVFLTVVLIFGLLAVPRLLRYVNRFRSNEMLLVTSLAVCFGFSLLAAKMGYSVALGAFVAGAVVAEAREHGKIEVMMEPVRDMFTALFFVAIGMTIQPAVLLEHALPIVVITLAVMFGKIFACTVGCFVTGTPPATALKVGSSLAQIGEFSFIIAALGLSLGVISDFLYPVVVTVSAITTLFTPYLIKNSDKVGSWLARVAPRRIAGFVESYSVWFSGRAEENRLNKGEVALRSMLRRWAMQMGLNLVLVTSLFVAAPFIVKRMEGTALGLPEWAGGVRSVVWFGATAAALPLLVVMAQKLRAGSMLVAEMWTMSPLAPVRARAGEALVAQVLFILGATMIALYIMVLSIAVLPPWPVAVVLGTLLVLILIARWHSFARIYARAQSALRETLAESSEMERVQLPERRPMSTALNLAEIKPVYISEGAPAAGKLIRELELRSQSGASAVAIERSSGTIINPGPDEEIIAGDRVLLLGSRDQIEKGRALLQLPPVKATG